MQVEKVQTSIRRVVEQVRRKPGRAEIRRSIPRLWDIFHYDAVSPTRSLARPSFRAVLAGLMLFIQVGAATAATVSLKGTSFPVAGASEDPLKQIWADRISAAVANQEDLRRTAPSLKPLTHINAEIATFGDGATTIIVSFIDSRAPQECESFSNVGLPESVRECPMRIALVRDGNVKTVFSAEKYCMAFKFTRASNVYDDHDSRVKTEVTYDPRSRTISVKALDNGRDVCDSQAPIPLKF